MPQVTNSAPLGSALARLRIPPKMTPTAKLASTLAGKAPSTINDLHILMSV